MTVTILLADDHNLMRAGLRALLEKDSNFKVVGEAATGREVLSLSAKLVPQVVIMDITMPDTNGIEATRRLLDDDPRLKVIGLSMHSDKRTIREMLKAGAVGYLPKDCARDELHQAIRTVTAGQVYISPKVARVVTEGFVYGSAPEKTAARDILSSREIEVLQLLAEGKSTKEIAHEMGLSAKTVESHRKKISDKLGIQTVAELTKYALREGLTSLDF